MMVRSKKPVSAKDIRKALEGKSLTRAAESLDLSVSELREAMRSQNVEFDLSSGNRLNYLDELATIDALENNSSTITAAKSLGITRAALCYRAKKLGIDINRLRDDRLVEAQKSSATAKEAARKLGITAGALRVRARKIGKADKRIFPRERIGRQVIVHDRLVELIESGVSVPKIAKSFGVSTSAVYNHCNKNGYPIEKRQAIEAATDEHARVRYMDLAIQTGIPSEVIKALCIATKAVGERKVAEAAGIPIRRLNSILTEGSEPRLSEFLAIIKSFDYRLSISQSPAPERNKVATEKTVKIQMRISGEEYEAARSHARRDGTSLGSLVRTLLKKETADRNST